MDGPKTGVVLLAVVELVSALHQIGTVPGRSIEASVAEPLVRIIGVLIRPALEQQDDRPVVVAHEVVIPHVPQGHAA